MNFPRTSRASAKKPQGHRSVLFREGRPAGVPGRFHFERLNIGNIHNEECIQQCAPSVLLGEEDISAIRELAQEASRWMSAAFRARNPSASGISSATRPASAAFFDPSDARRRDPCIGKSLSLPQPEGDVPGPGRTPGHDLPPRRGGYPYGLDAGGPGDGTARGGADGAFWIDHLPIGTYIPPNETIVTILTVSAVVLNSVGRPAAFRGRPSPFPSSCFCRAHLAQKGEHVLVILNERLARQAVAAGEEGDLKAVSRLHMRALGRYWLLSAGCFSSSWQRVFPCWAGSWRIFPTRFARPCSSPISCFPSWESPPP